VLLRAVQYVPTSEAPSQLKLAAESSQAFAESLPAERPAAFVVQAEDLPKLRTFKEIIVDRGAKHRAKELSYYLFKQDKMPLIDGSSYKSVGQLQRSIRTLLQNAQTAGENNRYIIGVGIALFQELWEQVASAQRIAGEATKTLAAPSVTSRAMSAPESAIESRLLLELLPQSDVPAELHVRYAGTSVEVQLVRRLIMRAAEHEEPVLILGDTGTGKEVVARAIHKYSQRRDRPFTAINCGAIPTELLESELFGHVRGAFTGANLTKKGLWEVASSGTLFLDELGDLSMPHQVKILRTLQEKKIRRIGAAGEIAVDTRIIAATNRNLFAMVQNGQFREDLYYRLRQFLIRTPALRDHPEDIPALTQAAWKKITGGTLPQDIVDALQQYAWPGNVRELKGVLSSLHALFGTDRLRLEHLRALLQQTGQTLTPPPQAPSTATTSVEDFSTHRLQCLRHLRRVDEVVRACKVAVRPVVVQGRTTRRTVLSVQETMQRLLNEIDLLCLHPLLFHSETAFTVVYRLKGKLTYFLSLLPAESQQATRHWKQDVAGEFKQVLTILFQEVEQLLAHP
jgi:DNA-binding NtrC family response regulator